MKVINKSVTELQDVTITHVSYVKRGANKRQFLLSKSETKQNPDVEFDVKVVKKDDDIQKLLYGIVYEPEQVDSHGDVMKADEIEKTANEFLVHYRNIDTEHNLIAGAGQVVQSYIAPCDLTIGKSDVKAGSWILVTKATDEIWQDYLDGEITGYSMFGIARKTVAKTEDIINVSWIQKVLEKMGVVKSFDETLNEVIRDMSTDPFFLIQIMEEDFWKNINWDSTRAEDLKTLSMSMREASSYIDSIVNTGVVKSDNAEEVTNEDETTEETAVVETITENTTVNEDEVTEDTDSNDENENSDDDNVKTVELSEVEQENERLKAELIKKQEEIDKITVKSSLRVQKDYAEVHEKAKPQLF